MVPVSLHPPRFGSLYSLYCKWGGVVVGLATKMEDVVYRDLEPRTVSETSQK